MRGHPVRVIPRELLLALNRLQNAGDMKVVMVVIDNTIGWQRVSAEISFTTFCQDTGLSRFGVEKIIKRLERQNVLAIPSRGTTSKTSNVYVLKDLSTWSIDPVSPKARPQKHSAELHSDIAQSCIVDSAELHSTMQLTTPAADAIKKERNSLRNSLKKGSEGGTGETDSLLKEKNEEENVSLNEENGGNDDHQPDLVALWKYLLDDAPPDTQKTPAMAILKSVGSLVSAADDTIEIGLTAKIFAQQLQEPENREVVAKIMHPLGFSYIIPPSRPTKPTERKR